MIDLRSQIDRPRRQALRPVQWRLGVFFCGAMIDDEDFQLLDKLPLPALCRGPGVQGLGPGGWNYWGFLWKKIMRLEISFPNSFLEWTILECDQTYWIGMWSLTYFWSLLEWNVRMGSEISFLILRQDPEVCPGSQRTSGQVKMTMMRMMMMTMMMMIIIVIIVIIIIIILILIIIILISSWGPKRNPNDCMVNCSMGLGHFDIFLKPYKKL